MSEIIYQDCTAEGPAPCRELFNALMQHQAAMAERYADILASMTYESRMEARFPRFPEKLLLLARDGGTPVGYICAVTDLVTGESKAVRPPWIGRLSPEDRQGQGFYPPEMDVPCTVGEIYNLFVLPDYRGRGVGKELMDRAMAWLERRPQVQKLFVMVSNGNNAGDFYRRYGFVPSHPVLGGFLTAYSRDK